MNPRLLIVVAILIVLVAVVVVVVLPTLNQTPPPTDPGQEGQPIIQNPDETPLPTATAIEMVEIVIAVQDLPRGFRIPPNAVTIAEFPAAIAPFNVVTNLEDVVGTIARTDIFREQPILSNMVVEDLTDIARIGSDAAAILPNTLVAVSMPIDRITSVAYAVQDGDRVDIIMSMLFVDIDEDFQTIEPSLISLFQIREDGIEILDAIEGRPDTTSIGPVIIGPSERQRPRLVTQRTIQDAFVVHVGNFPIDGRFIGVPPTPTPIPVEVEESENPNTPPPPTPTPARPDIITLGVTPQDAVILTWAIEAKLPLTLALRSATDTSRVPTDAVTLDYVMNEFSIALPQRRPYSIEPAIRSIRQIIVGDQINLDDAEQSTTPPQ